MSVYSFSDVSLVAKALGAFVKEKSEASIKRHGVFTLALSGGSLPKVLAEGLAQQRGIEFSKWEVFFADERIVPLDDENSNYALCKKLIFDKFEGFDPKKIHTINPELLKENPIDPQNVADEYEKQLVHVFANSSTVKVPVFDLLLLGCGPDGHTCSLFPDHEVLQEDVAWVAPVTDSPKPPKDRITLTLPVVTHAQAIAFVTTGAGKKDILPIVIEDFTSKLPSALITRNNLTRTSWFVDDEASANLERSSLKVFPQ
ncbi:putative 6-phosphogluconolactonase [Schizosaccharomyces pombe]|uniref:Probable 6-phosphogluconolactonase n=1 Tax=Schizosaccharomyces pombe (strain 972 / ATCC 24843) TaxID=284812 RepID=6PGL_SCHPO|nr:putative 6-phosphogluconolactonase [Schizosaccharomyces pombe]O74455.1 RecName: Full=Probable 6-phosphogluconolactonase; Short=6PGL [Schizosaccharomyces pombe 972h-]CAA20749.1 6-phosphogluconolactonase (predicted) [Schizosaccharomyces pombe]|eukprot:NP_587920.1 putative 6-phosphogluconolactonase [Schizosaccharomyces pombe]